MMGRHQNRSSRSRRASSSISFHMEIIRLKWSGGMRSKGEVSGSSFNASASSDQQSMLICSEI